MSLRLSAIHHSYPGLAVVRGVSFAVAAEEVVCLLGPSGCGKTTLLRLIAGLERLQQGEIAIDNAVVAAPGRHVAPEHRPVGMVFQDYVLFPHLSVTENIAFGLQHLAPQTRTARVRACLEQMELTGWADCFPHTLSGGQQQRVALARALARDPKVMLLDEPFSGLDTALRATVRAATRRVLKDSGTATLIVTHDPQEALALADRIIVLRDGRVAQIGSPAALYAHPVDADVARLFGAAMTLHGTVRGGGVDTAFGRIAVPQLAEGTPAEIVVRPEAMRLDQPHLGNDGGVPGQVTDITFLGGLDRVGLACGGNGRQATGAALATAGHGWRAGDTVDIHLLPEKGVYVFPRSDNGRDADPAAPA